jgi:hypothetical protein
MVNITPSLEGTQVRFQTALDKQAGTVTAGTLTAGSLIYWDTSGGFSQVSTATAAASYQKAPQIWVADFTQSAGNEVTAVRGFCRVILDSAAAATVNALLYPSTVSGAAGDVSTVQWATWAPIVGVCLQTGAASATIQAYISPDVGANL